MYDCIIIGGGTAGLMAQYQLASTGMSILLIEKNTQIGKKLSITGNGRCNVTNNYTPKEFMQVIRGTQKKFFYKALHGFSPLDVVTFFESRGVPLKLEQNGQYFPVSDKASDIISVLSETLPSIDVAYNEEVKTLSKNDHIYTVQTAKHSYKSRYVVVATGSQSFPSTGSSGDGITFAKEFGLETTAFYPAETKVYSSQIEALPLQGLSISDANVHIKDTKIHMQGDILFTHNGLSGPAIYHLSEDIYHTLQQRKVTLLIDLLNYDEQTFMNLLKEHQNKTLESIIAKRSTKRLASTLFAEHELPKKPIKDLHKDTYKNIYDFFTNYPVVIDHVEDITKAYVNGGGVLTKELDPKTMSAKKAKHCYFVGEGIDLHGPIGGFNITIAFATAVVAARSIKEDYYARTS